MTAYEAPEPPDPGYIASLRAAIVTSISDDDLPDKFKLRIDGSRVYLRVEASNHPFYGPTYEFYELSLLFKQFWPTEGAS